MPAAEQEISRQVVNIAEISLTASRQAQDIWTAIGNLSQSADRIDEIVAVEAGKEFALVAGRGQGSSPARPPPTPRNTRNVVLNQIKQGLDISDTLVPDLEGLRDVDMAQTSFLVQLIVRNLYEHTADVR